MCSLKAVKTDKLGPQGLVRQVSSLDNAAIHKVKYNWHSTADWAMYIM